MSFGAVEAVLFDLDGVVIDTNQAVTDFWQSLAGSCIKSLTEEELRLHVYGCQANHTLDILFPDFGNVMRESVLRRKLYGGIVNRGRRNVRCSEFSGHKIE